MVDLSGVTTPQLDFNNYYTFQDHSWEDHPYDRYAQ